MADKTEAFFGKDSKAAFSRAIVRKPCRRIAEGLASADLGKPDYEKALAQHDEYVAALRTCGLQVTVLPADERYPDSTFVEDAAILTPCCAILTNPGAEPRRGEVEAIREVVAGFYDRIETIQPPATIEGGDVMRVGNRFYIGLSERTNEKGANQLMGILSRYGMEGLKVRLNGMLHLKTGVGYLEKGNLLITEPFFKDPAFRPFHPIEVEKQEAYAANSLWINDTVLVPEGFPATRARIESAGYDAIPVDVSEYRKIDGGLSCLSLRF
jgi:dimethylargininase